MLASRIATKARGRSSKKRRLSPKNARSALLEDPLKTFEACLLRELQECLPSIVSHRQHQLNHEIERKTYTSHEPIETKKENSLIWKDDLGSSDPRSQWFAIDLRLRNWSYGTHTLRLPTHATFEIVLQRIYDMHGGVQHVKRLRLFRAPPHESNEIVSNDFEHNVLETLCSKSGDGKKKTGVILYYDFAVVAEGPLLLKEPELIATSSTGSTEAQENIGIKFVPENEHDDT